MTPVQVNYLIREIPTIIRMTVPFVTPEVEGVASTPGKAEEYARRIGISLPSRRR